MPYKVSFKERLSEALKIRNMTKQTLCEQSGVNKGTISKYYSDKLIPKMETVEILADVLRVNPVWLMGYNVQMEKNNETPLYLKKIINKVKTLNEVEREKVYNVIIAMFPDRR